MRASRFRLTSGDAVEACALAGRIRALVPVPPDVTESVRDILAAVRERGDDAILELTRRFDSTTPRRRARLDAHAPEAALEALDPGVRRALEVAVENVRRVSAAELTGDTAVELPQGHRVELKELAVRCAGAYVPGGRAAYPSTVVMCCVPARVAGVSRIVVATPPRADGEADPTVLGACALCGVDEVHLIGGAQAIAALAFGTAEVEPVDVVVGPGNAYVQEAKRQVAGVVGIDGVAGPSELVVVCGEDADANAVALDLAAQAEHGSDSLVAAVSPSATLLGAVEEEVAGLSRTRATVSDVSLALVEVADLEAAMRLVEAIAPEHLELIGSDAAELAGSATTSGCVFVGAGAATAFGDYVAGSSHVLPTGGSARHASPLGSATFRRRQALVSLPQAAARALAPHVRSTAQAEGFPVHAESAEARGAAGAADSS